MEQEINIDRMQLGFQQNISTLQAALYIAAMIESKSGKMLEVLYLAKAYERVIRQLLIDKIIRYGVPTNLINQLIVFILPLLARTEGDVTETIEVFTTGLVQGGTASRSPALFGFLIDDLSGDLRAAKDGNREVTGTSLDDPGKLVAENVILIARTAEELQIIL